MLGGEKMSVCLSLNEGEEMLDWVFGCIGFLEMGMGMGTCDDELDGVRFGMV